MYPYEKYQLMAVQCSGILLNAISEHKALFKDIKYDKYIEIERCTDENIAKVLYDLNKYFF